MKNFPESLLRAMSEGYAYLYFCMFFFLNFSRVSIRTIMIKIIFFRPDPSRGPWTVKYRTMKPFLEYCPDALLRSKVWLSSVTFGLHEEMTALNVDLSNIRYAR